MKKSNYLWENTYGIFVKFAVSLSHRESATDSVRATEFKHLIRQDRVKKRRNLTMKRKLLALLMVMVMAFALTACGDDAKSGDSGNSGNAGGDDTKTESTSGDLIKVGIINNDPNESGYRTANDKDLQAKFTKENGYEAQFAYSLKNDEQQASAKKFIEDGVDYLLLSAADTAGWDSVLKQAQDAGTKVILFDRTIDADPSLYEASIVSDMDKEGQTAVDWLAGQNLSEYNVIHIQGVMGSAAQKGRSGALQSKADAESNWNIVEQQTAEWNAEKAQQIVQSVIDGGKKFNVIYAENDDMAKGAVAALDKANISHGVGKDVIVMGFDCNKWALEELLKKNWNYDGQCNPFQSSYIDDVIKKLQNGEQIAEKTIIMDEKGFDATTITQEDVDSYGI